MKITENKKKTDALIEEIVCRGNVAEAYAYAPDATRQYILIKIMPDHQLRTSSLKKLCAQHGFEVEYTERHHGILGLAFFDQKNKSSQFDWPGGARKAFADGVCPR